MVKRIISVAVVIATIFCLFTVSVSAASYATGTYSINSSAGVNVRKGAGTGYAKVGAAKSGTTFVVSKVSNGWGYTSSIKCTNGTKSGWVSLSYCKIKQSTKTASSKYSTGSYYVNTNIGLNVRKGAGTNYSKVGSAANKVTFNVSKVSGDWGYTSSIKCTNGTKSGWVLLSYCAKQSKSTNTTSNKTNSNTAGSTWDSKVGKTVASIKSGSSYTKWYNSSGNLSAKGGYYGQCTWYAYGRFYEVNNIKLKTAPDAKKWLNNNKNDSRLKVVNGSSGIKPKSIAVRTTGTWGHVMFIEHVTYNSKGQPQYVYFTECNADGNGKYNAGKDCILQKMTFNKFVSSKNPAGYIYAK